MEKKLICCICGKPIVKEGCPDYFGNNPFGAMWKDESGNIVDPEFKDADRCCDDCDQRFVIPGRIYKLYNKGEK